MIVGWFAAWFALENGLLSMNVCVFSVFFVWSFQFFGLFERIVLCVWCRGGSKITPSLFVS